MSAKLGLLSVAVASVFALGSPAFADGTATSTTSPAPTSVAGGTTSTTSTASPAGTTSTTTTTTTTSTSTTTTSSVPATTGPPTVGSTTSTEAANGGSGVGRAVVGGPSARLAETSGVGPATANDAVTPHRGTQKVITPPPPPPTTLAPWDPYAPPANSGSGRRVVYSKSKQTVWAYDSGNTLIKVHRVSGKQTPYDPAPGVYHVWSRSRRTYAVHNPSITWSYMVRFAHGAQGGNIGLHEIPYQYGRPVQSIWQLGQPLSGGCVRQAPADAIWMWNWAQIGTTVVVTP